MSRCYRMHITVEDYIHPDKQEDIAAAIKKEWDYDEDIEGIGFYENDGVPSISVISDGNLCAGETEEEFVKCIREAVWEANGAYCSVEVTATCLEYMPCELYGSTEEEYNEYKKQQEEKNGTDNTDRS